jgi:tetrapyrrole methylase family protein / MazG family protein
VAGRVVVVGLGPAGVEHLAESARQRIADAPVAVLRTRVHPAAEAFGDLESYDAAYEQAASFEELYVDIVADLVARAERHGEVVYAVPGSPLVAERTVELLRLAPVELEVVPALGFADLAWAALGVDPLAREVRLVDAMALRGRLRGPGPILLVQCHSTAVLSEVKLAVDADLLAEPPRPILLHHLGLDDERVEEVAWEDLDRLEGIDHLTSLWLPELRTVGPAAEDLVDLMATLRAECPWDQRQTHASLTRHLLEEAYEAFEALEALAEALETGTAVDQAYDHAAEELGDLAFQVVFHAHLAAEAGQFDLTQVLDDVVTKLVGRHPHVFGDVVAETPDEVAANWEDLKRAEKGRASVTEGIPRALPALARYAKLLRKAQAIGLAPPPAERSAGEVRRSLVVLVASPRNADDAESTSLGPEARAVADALTGVVELARAAGVDPEVALARRASELEAAIIAAEQS